MANEHKGNVMGGGSSDHSGTLLDAATMHQLVQGHHEMQLLCDLLETIADSLPDNIDARKCTRAAQLVLPLTEKIHKFVEAEVFPAFALSVPATSNTRVIERLKSEYCEDECYAEELTDALGRVTSGGEPIAPETLGYMLRGFFNSMRRHIAYEREQFLASA